MVSEAGWIKLYRGIWSCEIWEKDEPFDIRSAWIDMLLMANREPGEIVEGRKIRTINRGQFKSSVSKLSVRWHRSRGWVRRYIDLLQNLKMIDYKIDKNGLLVTLCNFNVYQGFPQGYDTTNDTTDDTTTDTTYVTTNGTQTRSKEYIKKREVNINRAAEAAENPFTEENGWES